MSKLRFIIFTFCLIMVYTQGLWERLFLLPSGTTFIIELPLLFYLFLSLKRIFKPTPARTLVILFVIVSFLLSLLNGSGVVNWVKYIRFFIYSYLLYASIWNSNLTKIQWNRLIKLSVFLILIQGIGSAFNIFVLGQRVEGHVGLMSSLGGTTATIFPLFVISLVVTLFLFSRRQSRRQNLWFLLLIISSILVGYGSGKRAIYIAVPIFAALVFMISYLYLKKKSSFYAKSIWLLFFVVLSIPIYFFGVTSSRGFNYGLSGAESNIEILKEVMNYTQQYESATTQSGETIGRSGTTLQVVANSFDSFSAFISGYGYGAVKDESAQSKIGIGYGIVGFTRDIISGGWLVMILTFLFFAKIILTNKSTHYVVTHVLRMVVLAVFIFSYFTYSSDFVVSLKITFLMLILLVLINSPNSTKYLSSIIDKRFYTGIK